MLGLGLAILAGTAFGTWLRAPLTRTAPAALKPARSIGLLGASFPDYRRGWLLTGDGSAGGKLWRTADGGKSWSLGMQLDRFSTFGGLGLGSESGYVTTVSLPQGLGVSGRWISQDSGRSFEQHPFPNPPGEILLGETETIDGGAFAVFGDEVLPPRATIYSLQPGGGWDAVAGFQLRAGMGELPLLGDRTAIAFLDRRHGAVVTITDRDAIVAYVTADGGRTWVLRGVSRDYEDPPSALSAVARNGVLIVTAAYPAAAQAAETVMFMSYDSGASWTSPERLPTRDGLETPALAESDVWWVPMGGSVSVTRNAGADWLLTTLDVPRGNRVEAIYPIDERQAWAFVGSGGRPPQYLFETLDGGATWTSMRPPA